MLPSVVVRNVAGVPFVGPRLLIRAHRQGSGFDVVDWAQFAELVSTHRPDAVTVDVFETCIVRDLAGDASIENVIELQASQSAASGQEHVDVVKDIAAAAEIEMCNLIDGADQALAKIRSVVGGITFISDTERSSDLLEQILRQLGIFCDGDRVVVSCEEGVTKSDGGQLFDRIWVEKPGVVWHVGNNAWSDGVMAAAHGFRPFEIPSGNLTRYEAAMSRQPASFGPALAGAARSARLALEEELRVGVVSERDYQLQLLGTQVAGPVISSFVLWIAEQCREHEIGHVAFLARDGELPMQVAAAMSADHLGGVPTSYLHCNRLVVTLASACAVGVEQWLKDGTADDDSFLEVNRHLVPFSLLLDRIGFEIGDVATSLGADHRLARLSPDQVLPRAAVDEWHELLSNPTAAELISSRSTNRRDLLVDHVRSHGIGQEPVAMVDVGWRGRLAWLLSSVLRDYLQHEPLHLHFGGEKVIPGLADGVRIERFAFDGLKISAPSSSPVSTVETITASGKPRVVDYRRKTTGEIELVYDKPTDGGTGDRIDEVWQGALRMASAIPSRKILRERGLKPVALDHEVRTVLSLWWNKPTTAEAAALTDLDFEHDEAGTSMRPVVAPYHLSDVLGGRQARQWAQGSIAVSSPVNRLGVRLVFLARRLRDRLHPTGGAS